MNESPPTQRRREIESPCVRMCCLDPDDICVGCFRTLKEICTWADAPEAERIEILARCDQRRQRRNAF